MISKDDSFCFLSKLITKPRCLWLARNLAERVLDIRTWSKSNSCEFVKKWNQWILDPAYSILSKTMLLEFSHSEFSRGFQPKIWSKTQFFIDHASVELEPLLTICELLFCVKTCSASKFRDQREAHLGCNYDHWLCSDPWVGSRDQKTEARDSRHDMLAPPPYPSRCSLEGETAANTQLKLHFKVEPECAYA